MAVQLGECAGAAITNAHLYDEAKKAIRLDELFSGVVGHDLRNSLAAIMAATQLMLAAVRQRMINHWSASFRAISEWRG